mmetsp:Transcript_25795/g.64789  ORF Transcript_25795/g.64789 Transcript_25795/m.64789 type:complete len:302 (+) Transcript_25795:82-987(+)
MSLIPTTERIIQWVSDQYLVESESSEASSAAIEERRLLLQRLRSSGDDTTIYGRFTTVQRAGRLTTLTTSSRRYAFCFGSDTVVKLLSNCEGAWGSRDHEPEVHPLYRLHLCLGFEDEHMYRETVLNGLDTALVLFRPSERAPVLPATWAGVRTALELSYPEAVPYYDRHIASFRRHRLNVFERLVGVRFLDVLHTPAHPLHFSYGSFLSMVSALTAAERVDDEDASVSEEAAYTRLFLYVELRLMDLFHGEGRTMSPDGLLLEPEFLVPTVPLSELCDVAQCSFRLPLPDRVIQVYQSSN